MNLSLPDLIRAAVAYLAPDYNISRLQQLANLFSQLFKSANFSIFIPWILIPLDVSLLTFIRSFRYGAIWSNFTFYSNHEPESENFWNLSVKIYKNGNLSTGNWMYPTTRQWDQIRRKIFLLAVKPWKTVFMWFFPSISKERLPVSRAPY